MLPPIEQAWIIQAKDEPVVGALWQLVSSKTAQEQHAAGLSGVLAKAMEKSNRLLYFHT